MYSIILTILHKSSGRSTVTVVDGFQNANDATIAGTTWYNSLPRRDGFDYDTVTVYKGSNVLPPPTY
jgi:hypothetical protein